MIETHHRSSATLKQQISTKQLGEHCQCRKRDGSVSNKKRHTQDCSLTLPHIPTPIPHPNFHPFTHTHQHPHTQCHIHALTAQATVTTPTHQHDQHTTTRVRSWIYLLGLELLEDFSGEFLKRGQTKGVNGSHALH